MNLFKDWVQKLKDPTRDAYERRYRLFAMIGISMIAFWAVIISVFDYQPQRTALYAVTVALFVPMMVTALKTGKIQRIAVMSSVFMVFVVTPVIFFLDGGITAGSAGYAAMTLFFIMTTVSGKLQRVLAAVDLIVITACFLVAYYYPELVRPLENDAAYINAYVSIAIIMVIVYFIFQFQLYMFRQERDILDAQKQEIEDLNRSQNRFFSSMSHEIRTPINTIIGMNELIMRDRTLSYKGVEQSRAIDRASKMLLALINDILDVSKMESGKMDIVPVEYDVANILFEVTGMIGERAAEKGLQFHVNVDEALPQRLYGDEVRIKQVLVNLLNNAVKYTKQGSVTMSVQGDRLDDNRIMMVARVEDTGMGIKKEAIPHLFEAFKRVDEEKNRNIEGTGLGLSIVKQIMDLMGGEIGVSSVYTKGSTFTISLPQTIVDSTPVGEIDLRLRKTDKTREYYKQTFEAPDAKLLIVDDNEMNLIVERGLLAETKMTIDTALSGELALKKTQETAYDVIFMDHLMPEMDGIECLKQIRSQEGGLNRETPVIALTANAGSENQALYASSGFNGYLLKPVSGAQLEETLLRILPEGRFRLTGTVTTQAETDSVFGKLGRKKRVMITMDSGCDLPKEWTDRFDIGIASSLIETDHGIFRDNSEIDSNELMRYLEDKSHHARSHPPTVAQYERLFGAALSTAQSVIHITLTGDVSNGSENAREAAKSFDNVTVYDSGSISSGAGMMAVYAAHQAAADRSAEEILFNLRLVKPQIHASFVLESGAFLVQGGRLNPTLNAFLNAFLLHPVLRTDGAGTRIRFFSLSTYRRRYIRNALLRYRAVDTSLLFLCHVGLSEQELREVRAEIDRAVKFERIVVLPASGAIAVNCGPGSLGLVFRTYGNDRETGRPLFRFLPEDEKAEAAAAVPEEEEWEDLPWQQEVSVEDAEAAVVQTGLQTAQETAPEDAFVLDEAAGIRNCGSKEAYEGVKKMFAESAMEKAAEIERYFEEEDWENYTIKVHALKSSALLIGATALSERAAHLEAMGNGAGK